MIESEIFDGVQEITLESWKEFFPLSTDKFAFAPAYVYRGQAKYDWALESTMDRHERQFPSRKHLGGTNSEFFTSRPLSPEEHLGAFKRATRGRRGYNPPQWSDDDYWALGQHHGLCTPLMDFTRSPYAALFFAFEHEKICVEDRMIVPEFRGIFALSTATIGKPEHKPEKEEDWVRLISPDSDANFRLVSQGGLFAKLPRKTDLETYVRNAFKGDDKGATFLKVKLPSTNEQRHECLVALNKMNLNYMTLFPDIEGAAKHVNSIWQPGHEDSLRDI